MDDVVDVEIMEEKASTSCSQQVLLQRRAVDIRIAIFTIVDDDFVICSNLPYETPIELGMVEPTATWKELCCRKRRGRVHFIILTF